MDQARRAGASWTEIGQYMGVSKQAAQKRFVPRESEELALPSGAGLSRFTMRARNVVQHAKAQARDLGHDQVGNEHLVLGLLSEPEGLAAKAIVALGPTPEQVRAEALALLEPDGGASRRRVRFSRGAKKTVELALREALHMGHNYIGTEHIMLSLLRNDQESAAELLSGLGVTRNGAEKWIRTELAALYGQPSSRSG